MSSRENGHRLAQELNEIFDETEVLYNSEKISQNQLPDRGSSTHIKTNSLLRKLNHFGFLSDDRIATLLIYPFPTKIMLVRKITRWVPHIPEYERVTFSNPDLELRAVAFVAQTMSHAYMRGTMFRVWREPPRERMKRKRRLRKGLPVEPLDLDPSEFRLVLEIPHYIAPAVEDAKKRILDPTPMDRIMASGAPMAPSHPDGPDEEVFPIPKGIFYD